MNGKPRRPWLSVIAGGGSVVSHAGGALLVETARRSGLTKGLSVGLGTWRLPLAVHDPGKIVLDMAVAVALGGDAAGDVAGAPLQDRKVVVDLDATLVDAHSEKQDASRTWKKGFGFHPLLGFVDHGTGSGGGEPVAELLRPGKAGSNTATDHVAVLDTALAQIPEQLRQRDAAGRVAVLVRTDAAGATKAFAAHLAHTGVEFSLGANLGHFDIHPALALLTLGYRDSRGQ